MPTLVVGNNRTRQAGHARCNKREGLGVGGFTLLELLLVIAIVALVSTGAALALRDSAQAGLETQAQRLAALLESGRAQSRASGRAVRWSATAQGFALDGQEQTWQAPDMQAYSEQPLLLGPEPVIAPQSVTLWLSAHPEHRLRVATDGVRPFEVSDAPPQGTAPSTNQ